MKRSKPGSITVIGPEGPRKRALEAAVRSVQGKKNYACPHCHRVETLTDAPVVEWVCKTCGQRHALPGDVGIKSMPRLSHRSPQYVLEHNAGARFSRVNKRTGTTVTLYNAKEAGMDEDGGPWVTLCEHHGSLVNHETLALARDWMSAPDGWCSDCQELMQ